MDIKEIACEDVDWIQVVQGRDQTWAVAAPSGFMKDWEFLD
jgi:hypothetical protein